jgi:hypothetical protein
MKKTKVLEALLILLAASGLVWGESILSISMVVQKDGSATLKEIKLVDGRPTGYTQPGDYLFVFTDSTGKTVYKVNMSVDYNLYRDPPSETNRVLVELKVPYNPEMKYLKFYRKTTLLISQKINICDNNGKCDTSRESYLTCPKDCPLASKDDLCLARKDGICDPDCAKGADPDCAETQSVNMPEAAPKGGFDFGGLLYYGFVFSLIILLFGGLLYALKRAPSGLKKDDPGFMEEKIDLLSMKMDELLRRESSFEESQKMILRNAKGSDPEYLRQVYDEIDKERGKINTDREKLEANVSTMERELAELADLKKARVKELELLEAERAKIARERKELDRQRSLIQKDLLSFNGRFKSIKGTERKVEDYKDIVEKDTIKVEQDTRIVEEDTAIVQKDMMLTGAESKAMAEEERRISLDRKRIDERAAQIDKERKEIISERLRIEQEERRILSERKKIEIDRKELDNIVKEVKQMLSEKKDESDSSSDRK